MEIYRLSKWAKEELPTWAEVYEDFYQKQYFAVRSNENDPRWSIMDPYWKIPRYQFLLATVCNQFNKMLFEDGYKQVLIDELVRSKMVGSNGSLLINDIRFTCEAWGYDETEEMMDRLFVGLDVPPPIYTIPMPNGKPNPFIVNHYPRIPITKEKTLEFRPLIDLTPVLGGPQNHALYEPLPYGATSNDFFSILEIMMKPYREYFEGDGVGWKDTDGSLLMEQTIATGCKSGFDPAL